MNWRLRLAQRCVRQADQALLDGDMPRFRRNVQFARGLLAEVDAEDYALARKQGRVITLPPSAAVEVF